MYIYIKKGKIERKRVKEKIMQMYNFTYIMYMH